MKTEIPQLNERNKMSILPTDDAIARFKANEERVDIFVNDPLSTGYYTTNETVPRQVKTLPELADGIVESASLRVDLASDTIGKGDALIRTKQPFTGTVARTQHDKNLETISVKDFGAVGDGIADDTVAIQAAWNALADGGILDFPPAIAYKITNTLNFHNKGRVRIKFNGQLIDASSFTGGARPGVHFVGISQSVIDGIFLVGNKTSVSAGVMFDATAASISIHVMVGKIHVSGCNIGVMVGNAQGYQFSDSCINDIYGADCNIGVYLTGENTLAMLYGRVAAYNNTNYGVIIEQGGGCIESLQIAASGNDLFFGQTNGANHNKLNRWDILSGYSEEGVNGEIFINSASCSDANPFREQIVISGFRCTPFSSTNVEDFVKWNLNSDLIFNNCTFTHGTQLPKFKTDENSSYRSPEIKLNNCVIDCGPKMAVQVPMTYRVTHPSARVQMNCAVDNAMTFWHNNGSANEGALKRGIYTSKIKKFGSILNSIAGLKGAWTLSDITSQQCINFRLGKPALTVSATPESRDVWFDDGLIGFYRNSTTSKTISSTSSEYSKEECTFGCILRAVSAGVDETDYTALGGTGGVKLGIGDTGGGFVRCMVGAYNAQAVPTNPLDPHLVIGRWIPGTNVKIDAINLRTGEILTAAAGTGPALVDVTWSNGISIRNDGCVRGMPFVYNRAISDNEVNILLQSALELTDSWRL